jgi:hypothetical protein
MSLDADIKWCTKINWFHLYIRLQLAKLLVFLSNSYIAMLKYAYLSIGTCSAVLYSILGYRKLFED